MFFIQQSKRADKVVAHRAGSDNRREQTTATAAEIIQHGGLTYTRRFAVFDSTTYPDSDLTAKLEILSKKDYLRNTLEVSLSLMQIVSRSKIPGSLKDIILNAWVWCIPKIKRTLTDEVVLFWKFAHQNRSLSNYFHAVRITVVTTRAWLAG